MGKHTIRHLLSRYGGLLVAMDREIVRASLWWGRDGVGEAVLRVVRVVPRLPFLILVPSNLYFTFVYLLGGYDDALGFLFLHAYCSSSLVLLTFHIQINHSSLFSDAAVDDWCTMGHPGHYVTAQRLCRHSCAGKNTLPSFISNIGFREHLTV